MKDFLRSRLRSWLDVPPPKRRRRRSAYTGAKSENVLSSWIFAATNIDDILHGELSTLRTRSRDLAKNNFLVRGFLNQADINVLGPRNIRLQSRVMRNGGRELSEVRNRIIEENWNEFTGNCDVTGRGGLRQIDSQILRCLLRDGEAFVMRVRGWGGNRFKYGVKIVDPTLVDDKLNKSLGGGSMIRLGVELDRDGAPVAYYLKPPNSNPGVPGRNHNRVEAKDLLHVFIQEEPGQTRGVPRIAAAMTSLKHLEGFMEAAVVNARASALQMGFLESDADDEADLDEGDDVGDDGDAVWNMEAGIIRQLPPGRKFTSTDFGFPDAAMEGFVKVISKAITSSMPGSYASVAGDIENASWSALRNDEMRAKASWSCEQQCYIQNVRRIIYEDWLQSALLAGAIVIPGRNGTTFGLGDFDALNKPQWFPPVYPSADELKRQNANKLRLELGTASRQEIIAEEGKDMAEVDQGRKVSETSGDGIAPAVTMPSVPMPPTNSIEDDS